MTSSLARRLAPIIAVLLIAATSPARAQQPAPPAAESAALDLYRTWKAEPDPARKAALGRRIVAEHFGTKSAEAVGYAAMFGSPSDTARSYSMSKTYYDASLASGKTGAYVEYALGNLATLGTDPRTTLEYSRAYLAKYPSGKFVDYVERSMAAARFQLFDAAMKAKNWTEAIAVAEDAFAVRENEFLYSYILVRTGLEDFVRSAARSPFLGKVTRWSEIGLHYLATSPAQSDPGEKRRTLALFHKAQAVDRFLQLAASRQADPAAFQPVVDLLERATALDPNDPVVIYYLAQAVNAQYAIYAQRYDDLSEADKMGEPGKRLLEQIHDLADRVKAVHEKIRPGSVPSYVVPPRRVDPNRPEG